MLERRRILYSGRVQGVGFRATAFDLAARLAVSGFARNLADGRVEVEAQGDPAAVRSFLDAIRGEFGPKIREALESPITTDPDEASGSFQILH